MSPLSSLVKIQSSVAECVHALHLILLHVGEWWSPMLFLRNPVLPSIWCDSGLASMKSAYEIHFLPFTVTCRQSFTQRHMSGSPESHTVTVTSDFVA